MKFTINDNFLYYSDNKGYAIKFPFNECYLYYGIHDTYYIDNSFKNSNIINTIEVNEISLNELKDGDIIITKRMGDKLTSLDINDYTNYSLVINTNPLTIVKLIGSNINYFPDISPEKIYKITK